MPLEIQIGQLLDVSYLSPFGPGSLQIALNFVKNKSASMQTDVDCSLLPGCPEKARKTVIQLIMIEWGILGLGSSTPGLFLAEYYKFLGPYFGSVYGHNWPNDPLAKAPTPLESVFHLKMQRMTELMSHGKLSNVSLLDLPAFGSNIAWLRKSHKREQNWPTEMNYAIHNNHDKNIPEAFKSYKIQLTQWEKYMNKVYRKAPLPSFTPKMKVNQFFNFTKHITKDITTFLSAIHGSFLTASNETLPIWINVSKDLFSSKNVLDGTSGKSSYDKLIMQCGFKEDILKQKKAVTDAGCQLFTTSLTTNGLCYSFNGETTSNTWKSSEVTNSIEELFHMRKSTEVFEEAGINEGMLNKGRA